MVCLTVLYPNAAETPFNMDYYLKSHMPMAKEKLTALGLVRAEVLTGQGTLDGSPVPYAAICNLYFSSMSDAQMALMSAAPAIMADIPNYFLGKPVIQIGEVPAI